MPSPSKPGVAASHDPEAGGRLALAEAAIGAARTFARVLPRGVKKRIEDGIFYYIFQKTRVENDAYGWRPPPAGGARPNPEEPVAAPAPGRSAAAEIGHPDRADAAGAEAAAAPGSVGGSPGGRSRRARGAG